ncbi:MAG: nuclease-related domain-containing protein [Ilumatobacteraceae bacterium]
MIEGGIAGGSALQQAAQRRATSDRLLMEARWLEALAADEGAMAGRLAELPPAYAILHDLRLPGSKGNIDHLVVGPGGAFVVLTRRCVEAVDYREGQLWSGEQSLRDVLDAARVEAQLLTQSLATPVVPVVALLEAVLPAATPSTIDGVMVCPGERVVRVITRGSHTLMPPHMVVVAAERALPLLHNAGSVPRTESALGVRADPAPDSSVNPVVPPSPPPSEASVQRRLAVKEAASKTRRRLWSAKRGHGADESGAAKEKEPAKEKSGRSRSVRFIGVALLSLCLVAVAFGSLVRVIWDDSPSTGATSASESDSSTTTDAPTTPVARQPMAAAVAAPTVAFTPECPVPGAGWALLPVWPGDLEGLTMYDVEIQSLDGSWSQLPALSNAGAPWDALVAQLPNSTYTLRITAVMNDGSRSANTPTVISVPATDC